MPKFTASEYHVRFDQGALRFVMEQAITFDDLTGLHACRSESSALGTSIGQWDRLSLLTLQLEIARTKRDCTPSADPRLG